MLICFPSHHLHAFALERLKRPARKLPRTFSTSSIVVANAKRKYGISVGGRGTALDKLNNCCDVSPYSYRISRFSLKSDVLLLSRAFTWTWAVDARYWGSGNMSPVASHTLRSSRTPKKGKICNTLVKNRWANRSQQSRPPVVTPKLEIKSSVS